MKPETVQERQHAILMEIIQYYLDRQQAISARTLSKFSRLALSPTTIRNLMEDLSLDGYLTSNGVSRGRIPTQKAFTIFVTQIKSYPPDPASISGLGDRDDEQIPTLQLAMDKMGRFLAEETGFIALAELPEKDRYPLDWVRLVPISDERMLVAVQSVYGDLWSKVIPSAEPFPEAVLKDVEWHICRNYHGAPIEKIRSDIMSGEPKKLMENLPSLGAAYRLLRKAFDWEQSPGWQVWGMENLYTITEYQQPERMVRLHRAVEDPGLLRATLRNARAVDGGLVAIGTEIGYAGLEESSLVVYPFGDGNGWQGRIALLGPMRMDYGLVLSLVSQAASAISGSLADIRRNAVSPCA